MMGDISLGQTMQGKQYHSSNPAKLTKYLNQQTKGP